MEGDMFNQPIFVIDESNVARKISSLMDAIEFLEEWPVERHGLLHAAASDACYSAYDGRTSVEAARKAFAMGPQGEGDRGCARSSGVDDRT